MKYSEVAYPNSSFVEAVFLGADENEGALGWRLRDHDTVYVYDYGSDADGVFEAIVDGSSAGRLFGRRPSKQAEVDLDKLEKVDKTAAVEVDETPRSVRDWIKSFDGFFESLKSTLPLEEESADDFVWPAVGPKNTIVVSQFDEDGESILRYEISADAKFVLAYGSNGLEYISL